MTPREIDRPVIILGAPRAGTSILGRLLQAHPAFVHVKEPRFVWRFGNDGHSDRLLAVHARSEVIAHIRTHFAGVLGEYRDKRLLEKHPSNSLRVPFIERIFPDAIYVHIMRNGYDAAASIRSYWLNATQGVSNSRIGDDTSILRQRMKEVHPRQVPYYALELASRFLPARMARQRTLWGPRLPGLKQMVRDMDLIEVAAMQWRSCVELAALDGRALGPDRYMEVRLENLNLAGAERILNHTGLGMTQSVERHFQENFDPVKAASRRDALSDADRQAVRRVIAPTMQWLSYAETEGATGE
jgi:hypothetical protein